jgi:gliding motility-associated-like protein
MNLWGCRSRDSVIVYVDLGTDQFVPSAFTPNGDGKNDIFRIVKLGAQKLVDFRVYNRYGECIFQTANPEIGWDGTVRNTPQDIGTYTYEIIVAIPNGTNKVYKGNVTLIR